MVYFYEWVIAKPETNTFKMALSSLVLIVDLHSPIEVSTIIFGACLTAVFVNLSHRFNILKCIPLLLCLDALMLRIIVMEA